MDTWRRFEMASFGKISRFNFLRVKFWPLVFRSLLFLGFNATSYGQDERLRFEHFGIEEGLSNEKVTRVFQDSKGYLWMGTFDGLNKYDGYTFTRYRFNPFDSNSLSQNFIYTIFEDRDGSIWVSSFEGLCKFDRNTEKFTRYKPSPNAKFSNPNISVINEDRDGMIWVGSHSGGLCRFNKRSGTFIPEYFDLGYQKVPGNNPELKDGVNCIFKDRTGTLWVGNTTGLHKIILTSTTPGQLATVTFKNYRHNPLDIHTLSSNIVTAITEDRTGILWVATQNGLNSFDRNTGVFKRYLHDPGNKHSISSNNLQLWFGSHLKEDKEGNLWVGTDKGLNKLNNERTRFTTFLHDEHDASSISSNYIISIQIDNEGILWVGTCTGKLNKVNLNHKGFELKQHDPNNRNSLSNNEVTGILEDSPGVIWIATWGGGLNRWNKKTNEFVHFRHDASKPGTLRSDSISSIFEDSNGQLWVCNKDVLSRLNRRTGAFTHFNSNAANYRENDDKWIFSITEDREGLLWLGTASGLKSFDMKKEQFVTHFYHDPTDSTGLSDYTVVDVFSDSRDNIWIGHGSIATDRLNKRTNQFVHYKNKYRDFTSISSNIVNTFFEDSKGNLWLGTKAGGLCYFDYKTEKFTAFTDKHGLPGNTIYSIIEDNSNRLWLGTSNGLSAFDPVTKRFTNYDYKDGLQGDVFAAGERDRGAVFKGSDETLYFGGSNGFNFFNPSKIKATTHVAPVVITQFKLFDKAINGIGELKEIVLQHDENYFSFEFSSLSFYNPAKNRYAYKLEGFDKDWVYSGARRYAGYTNLDPGTYTFRVKGTNNDGIWNEMGTSISMVIEPPWWRTWWAYLLFSLTFIAVIYGLVRYRLGKIRMQHEITLQKQKAAELEMQALRAQMNPHFIFNSLNSINRFILENNKVQASEYLAKFSRLVRLILQNSEKALITLESEIESLRLYLELEAVRFDHHFQYHISVQRDLDISSIKVPALIIQPFVENAIWHGLMHKEEKGHLDIDLYVEHGLLCCVITDDGIGRSHAGSIKSKSSSTHKSMGIKITANRMSMLQQEKYVETPIKITDLVLPDGTSGGTSVLIRLPLQS